MNEPVHRLEADASGLGGVTGFELREALDRPYVLRLELTRGSPDFDGDAARETNVALEFGRPEATARRVTGMILRVANARRDGEGTAIVEVGPAFSLLALERTNRIFQDKTVPDILQEVLEEALGRYGRSIDIDLAETYEPREYCVQWQETTLDFVHRLMAEEGIAYHFDHAGATEVLALRDKNDKYADLAANSGATVSFSPMDTSSNESGTPIPEAVTAFGLRQQLGRTHVAVRDHDWSGPQTPEGRGGEADAQGRERESFEHGLGVTLSIGSYDEGAKRYQKNDSARQPEVRLQADRARLLVFEGEGTIPAMAPGLLFELTGEPSGHDGRYLITEADIRVREEDQVSRQRFVCIPVDVVHRPARTTVKPRIASSEVGTVAGPGGQEIHTDAHGRIMVRLPWDRGDSPNDRASCWMRVTQRWAGNSFGTLHIPRIGMEVIVRYIHGDPDRPIVTGALYRGDNVPPYPLDGEKTKSTIKSNSSLGGGGFNELRFEDKAGSEQIFLHGKKGVDEVVLNNHTSTIGNDQTNTVHRDQTQTIHKDQTEDVHGQQKVTVKGKRDVTVKGKFDEKVDGTETRKVKEGFKEIINGGQKRVIKEVMENISGGEMRLVMGGITEDNNATHTRAITGTVVRIHSGAFSHTASGNMRFESSGSMINLVGLGTMKAMGGPHLQIKAPVMIEFSGKHEETPGATKLVNTSVKVGLFGATASATGASDGSGSISISGAGTAYSATGIGIAYTAVSAGIAAADDTSTTGGSNTIFIVGISKAPVQKKN